MELAAVFHFHIDRMQIKCDLSRWYPQVIESSIAQASGLQEGDVVVRINDDPTIEMSHEDAHMKLLAAGDSFVLGVLRWVPMRFMR